LRGTTAEIGKRNSIDVIKKEIIDNVGSIYSVGSYAQINILADYGLNGPPDFFALSAIRLTFLNLGPQNSGYENDPRRVSSPFVS